MKAIDIVKVKQNIQDGLLAVEVHNGYILLKHIKSGEAVKIGEVRRCRDCEHWNRLGYCNKRGILYGADATDYCNKGEK